MVVVKIIFSSLSMLIKIIDFLFKTNLERIKQYNKLFFNFTYFITRLIKLDNKLNVEFYYLAYMK